MNDSLPTFDQLCADPHAAAQMAGGCTAVDDQTFQHVGTWIIAGSTAALVLVAVIGCVMLVSLAYSAFKALKRSLAA